jgi:plasmid maintenance system killer protein
MICSFRCADTQMLFETGKSRRFSGVASVATRKLQQLAAAAMDIPAMGSHCSGSWEASDGTGLSVVCSV